MKNKNLKLKVLFAIFCWFSFAITPAFAAESSDIIGREKFERSAVLVTNIFHPSKNFFTGIKGFLTSSANKVPFYIQVMDDKASETVTLIEFAPENALALVSALQQYQISVIQLQSSFNRFLNSQNAVLSWQSIADGLLRHLNFTDDMLMTVAGNNNALALLIDAQERLQEDMVNLLTRFNRQEMWIMKMTGVGAEANFAFSDLRVAERLRDLAVTAAKMGESATADMFSAASLELMTAISGRILGQLEDGDELIISDLERVSGASAGRLLSIEQLIELEPDLEGNEELSDLIAKLSQR